ncbi:MAG: TrkH family potassium uptake protein [Prevotellaceae bacterium]|jgi:trk system potassium uptake protein TrkH|nr:TrkH family potassium uptake protein [Prevotellaceae bacterium]
MRPPVVLRYIGMILVLNGAFMALAALIAFLNEGDRSFVPLVISASFTIITGLCPLVFIRPEANISNKEGYIIVIMAWLVCCFFGMLPYLLWGGEFNPVNAWFESVSGYTTTGSTILNDIEALPKGLLFFRACTGWIGGLGVVVFMLLLLPTIKNMKLRLAKVEISHLSKDNFKYRLQQTAHIIIGVYAGLTLLEFLLLWAAGMSPFDAITHSFSTLSSCGFSSKNNSILHYDSTTINVIVMVFMYAAGLHFGLIFLAVSGRHKQFFRSPVVRFYTLAMLIGILCVSVDLYLNQDDYTSWQEALHHGAFQVIATSSTTGFAIADMTVWPVFSILLLLYFSLQCACSGSTSGGIKADRMLILFQSIKTQIKKLQHPNAVISTRLGGTTIENDTVSAVAIFVLLYLLIVFVVTLFLSFFGIDMLSAFSSTVAVMGNVGPGYGEIAGSMGNFSSFPDPVKLVLAFSMLLGRLEIYGIIIIFFIRSWK